MKSYGESLKDVLKVFEHTQIILYTVHVKNALQQMNMNSSL